MFKSLHLCLQVTSLAFGVDDEAMATRDPGGVRSIQSNGGALVLQEIARLCESKVSTQ
jgi:hypothetical protein